MFEICRSRDGLTMTQVHREWGKGNRKPRYEVGSFTFCLCEEAFVSLGNNPCGSNTRHHRLSRHFGFPSYIYVISTIK